MGAALRIARPFAIALLALLVLAAILLGVLAGSTSVRGRVLAAALDRARAAVPGRLAFGSASWSSLSTLDLRGVHWVYGADTLLVVDHVHAAVDVGALLRREIVVESAAVEGARADIPAIRERFPSGGGGDGRARGGPARGLPPLAIRDLAVTAHDIVLTPGRTIDRLDLDLSTDLRAQPVVDVRRLDAAGDGGLWSVKADELLIDLRAWRFRGEADATVREPAPLRLHLASAGNDSLRVHAVRDEEGAPGVDVLDGAVVLGEDGRVIAALDWTVPWAERGPVAGTLRAEIGLDPFVWNARLDVTPNDWIDAGRLHASSDGRAITVDPLRVVMRGLAVEGSAKLAGERVDASLHAKADDAKWMSLLPGVTPPDELAFEATVTVAGDRASPALRAEATGGAAFGTMRIDRFSLSADVAEGARDRAAVVVSVEARNHRAAVAADVDWHDGVTALLSPLRIAAKGAPGAAAPPPSVPAAQRGRVAYDPASRLVTARNVRVTGTTGEMELSADYAPDADAEGTATIEWPRFPTLVPELLPLRPGQRDSLAAAWDPQTRITARASHAAAVDAWTARVSFRFPGPDRWRAVLPAAAHVSDLDTIRGRADLATGADGRATVSLDLERTAWLERAIVRGEGTRERFTVTEAALQGLGVTWSGSGFVGDSLSFDSRMDVADARVLQRFGVTELDSLTMAMTSRVGGTRETPTLEAELTASAIGPRVRAPRLTATASLGAPGWNVALETAAATLGAFPVDSLRAQLRTDGASFTAGRISVALDSPDLRARQDAAFTAGDSTIVRIDRLELGIAQGDLAATGPATVTLAGGVTAVDGLSLSGSLGTLEADGAVGPDGATGLRLEAAAAELPWAGGALAWTLSARTEADSVRAHVEARSGGETKLRLDAAVPSALVGPGIADHLDEVRIRAAFECFPLPLAKDVRNTERVACLDGSLEGERLRSAPRVAGSWDLSFPGWPRLAPYRLSGRVEGSGRGGAAPEDLEIAGIDLSTTLTRQKETVLEGSAHYEKEARRAGADGKVDVTLTSSELRLADFADLLPPDVSAQGTLAIDFRATGSASDPVLDGGVSGPVEFSTADGTRARGQAAVRVGGSLRKPAVRGDVRIERGTIQIPETPRALHPLDGDATLWQSRAASDTVAAPSTEDVAEAGAVAADIDLDVTIPSGLWIKGRGLEAELTGQLGIRQRDAEPAVSGELHAQRGSLLLLGRTFRMERGGVVFDGTPTINPELDFSLTTNVDAKLFRVIFNGTAQEPRLTLESEPDMPQGDIVSYLLFGRAVNELDTDQTSFLESRAADVAASMGLAGLETRIARELGMDLVRIRREGGASTVVLGKYLSPKALLQYEQNLVDGKGTRVNLEYLLKQGFKVDTLFGREGRSGMGLSWEKRY